jgi:hypothetical protein
MVEHLTPKHKAFRSNPSTAFKEREREKASYSKIK